MSIRPSSLPALAACAKFVADPTGSEYTTEGTKRHALFADLLRAGPDNDSEVATGDLSEADIEGVKWAVDYVRCKANTSEHPLVLEVKRSFNGPNFEEIQGTPDVVCGSEIFDLKWRGSDYTAQMAAYALMLLQEGHESVRVHILFAEQQRAQVVEFNIDEAAGIVFHIIESATDAEAEPTPNDFCGWCANRVTCPAVLRQVNAVIAGREDFNLQTWHASEITTADEMGKALRIAKTVAEWCESVEHHARELAIKKGIVATGFKLQSRKGNRYITSLADAFAKAGLPQDKFIGACDIKLTKLAETYAEHHQMKKAPAEREVEAKLGETIQRKASSMSLVQDK